MTNADQTLYWHSYNRFLKRKYATFAPKIYTALQAQIKGFINNGITHSNIEFVEMTPVAEVIKNLYLDVGKLWAHQAYLSVKRQTQKIRSPIGFNEEIINKILEYFRLKLLNEAVLPITETTREFIRMVLTRAQLAGDSIDDIVQELRASDLTKVRAELIARTEIMKAANAAEQFGIDRTGLKTNKTWIAARDRRTRDTHRHADGQTVPDGEPFVIGYGRYLMQRPGVGVSDDGRKVPADEVVNCRCCIGRAVIRDNRGLPLRKHIPSSDVVPQRVGGIEIKLM